MALHFDSTDLVDCASGTTLDNVSHGFALAWVYLDSSGANQTMMRKGSGTTNRHLFNFLVGGPQFLIDRGTTDLVMTANFANLTGWATGKWFFIAATWNLGGANGDQRMFSGDLTTLATEPSAYASQAVGSGAEGSDATDNLFLGNAHNGAAPLLGRMAVFLLGSGRQITLGEARQWQFRPQWVPNTVGFWKLGWHATSVPDLSGNANTGSITGASLISDCPVFGGWNGAQSAMAPYVIAVASTSSGWPDRRRRAAGVRHGWY